MADERQYYDQGALWGNAPDSYQVQLRADILSILPPDARSILDVGCGDGFVTNALPRDRRVVGIDISPQALKHLSWPAMLGSATELPFPDGAFDLVMASDVIEHIPPGAEGGYERCLAEMARVSSRYVLLAVPHGEQLQANHARCADCGCLYHVNWHQRRFTETTMRELLAPKQRLLELRFSGSDTRPPWDPLVPLEHLLGQYRVCRGGKCPACGSAAQAQPQQMVQKAMESCRSSLWAGMLREGAQWNDRSELLALYGREGGSGARVQGSGAASASSLNPEPRTLNPLDIDFSNPLQAAGGGAAGGFTGGARWSRFVVPQGAEMSGGGLRRRGDGPACAVVPIRIPADPRGGDRIVVRGGRGVRHRLPERPEGYCAQTVPDPFSAPEDVLSLWMIDGVSDLRQEILRQPLTSADQTLEVTVDPNWRPGATGLALEAHLYGAAVIRELRYLSETATAASAEFVRLAKGHNVLGLPGLPDRDYIASWGFLAEAEGLHPRPVCPVEEPEGEKEECGAQTVSDPFSAHLRQVFSRVDQAVAAQARERQRLVAMLEDTEKSREIAERAYGRAEAAASELIAQMGQIQAEADRLLAENERERVEAQARLTDAQGELLRRMGMKNALREFGRSARRRLIGPPLERLTEDYPPPWSLAEAEKGSDTVCAQHPSGRSGKRCLTPFPPTGTLKVLVISYLFPHPDQPGAGCFVLEQVRALREEAGIDARVLSGRPFWMHGTHANPIYLARKNRQYWDLHQSRQWMELDGVPVMYLPYRVMFGFWFHGWSYSRALCRNMRALRQQFPFDLIHAHSGYVDGAAGRMMAREFNVPLVITEHTGPFSNLMSDRRVRRQTLRSLEQAHRVIAVSKAQQADVGRHLTALAQQRSVVIHNGVDLCDFFPPPLWQPSRQVPQLLFVGGLDEVKNVHLLLSAFARVLEKLPQARLTVVGEGAQSAELRSEAARLKIDPKVTFTGRLERGEVARVMREQCDLLVLSSRSETFGCVLVEALACGKPVVATRCGGPEDIVTEPFLGRLCRNHDVEELARTLLEVIDQIETYSPQRIRRHAEERFGYPAIARRIAEVYREVLSGKC